MRTCIVDDSLWLYTAWWIKKSHEVLHLQGMHSLYLVTSGTPTKFADLAVSDKHRDSFSFFFFFSCRPPAVFKIFKKFLKTYCEFLLIISFKRYEGFFYSFLKSRHLRYLRVLSGFPYFPSRANTNTCCEFLLIILFKWHEEFLLVS